MSGLTPCQAWPGPSRRGADPGQPGPLRARARRAPADCTPGVSSDMMCPCSRWIVPGEYSGLGPWAVGNRSSQGWLAGCRSLCDPLRQSTFVFLVAVAAWAQTLSRLP